MRATLVVHILAGALGLASGYVALYAAKGERLHRRSGLLFVVTMLIMAVAGTAITAVRRVAPEINIPAGVLTAYLVVTALATVRPPARGRRTLEAGAMVVALAVGLTCLAFGWLAVTGDGTHAGMPAFPYLMFGTVGTLAAALDVRMLRAGPPAGASRLTRHLWRMCFALFIAAMSFFLGQSDEFPAALRIPALLALPVVVVLVTMLYWLWRVRIRRAFRGLPARVSPRPS